MMMRSSRKRKKKSNYLVERGLEPRTLGLLDPRSNQLSYTTGWMLNRNGYTEIAIPVLLPFLSKINSCTKSVMMSLVEFLPNDIWKSILSEWLSDFFSLDAALCNGSLRPKYLNCVHNSKILGLIKIQSVGKWDSLISWNKSRHAKFMKIRLLIDSKFHSFFFSDHESCVVK